MPKKEQVLEFYCACCGLPLYHAKGREKRQYESNHELLEIKRHGLETRHRWVCEAGVVYHHVITPRIVAGP